MSVSFLFVRLADEEIDQLFLEVNNLMVAAILLSFSELVKVKGTF